MVDRFLWYQLSLGEQLGQIAREIKGAKESEEEDDTEERSVYISSALELLELTLRDQRFREHVSELEYLYSALVSWQKNTPSWDPQKMINFCMSFLLDEELPTT